MKKRQQFKSRTKTNCAHMCFFFLKIYYGTFICIVVDVESTNLFSSRDLKEKTSKKMNIKKPHRNFSGRRQNEDNKKYKSTKKKKLAASCKKRKCHCNFSMIFTQLVYFIVYTHYRIQIDLFLYWSILALHTLGWLGCCFCCFCIEDLYH